MSPRVARALGLLVVLAVAGCAARSPRMSVVEMATLLKREQAFENVERWSLSGRVAVSDGRDGGSGRFEWTQDGPTYRIEIRAPVSQETWRLTGDDEQCQLEGVKPYPLRGTDPEALLAKELGWRLPIRRMRAWVRGLAEDPRAARIEVDADGLIRRLEEGHWTIDYKAWDATHQPPLPKRVFATSPPYKVRLAISTWSLDRG